MVYLLISSAICPIAHHLQHGGWVVVDVARHSGWVGAADTGRTVGQHVLEAANEFRDLGFVEILSSHWVRVDGTASTL
jgi:hypothetical protein